VTIRRWLRIGFSVAAISLGGAAWGDDAADPAPVPDDETLESQGALIGRITIHAASIFDTDEPGENKKILRAANKLHFTTRDRVVERQLTFKTGDRYSRAALDESERLLRHNGYLYDATIRPVAYDGRFVDLDVHTRDVWTLRPSVGFHRSGGVNAIRFGLHDANFFGFGKSVQLERVNGVDRTETAVSYVDPAFARSHGRFEVGYSANSDGSSATLGYDHAFWHRDAGWAAGTLAQTADRTDSLYALGEITNQFQEQHTYVTGYYGRLLGTRSSSTISRLLSGYTYDRSLFTALETAGATTFVPADRTLSYPWVGVNLYRDGFVRARDMDKMGRTEDVNLGIDMTAKFGWSSPTFGGDRSAAIVDLSWQSGMSPGSGQILTVGATATGRVTAHGVEDGLATFTTRYYHRDGEHFLFFAAVSGAATARLDGDHQLLLGGDNGLRGYPLRYAIGDKRLLLTLEERFFMDREFFHVLRIGAAVFADIGKAWSEMPNPAAHLGVLRDIGIGLRFGQTRSAHAGMVRVDIALPFDGPGGGLRPQILVTTGETF
jgi:outer membrane protein assembly factor BamA